ncbi:MAG: LysM peptidoglycan-binding domain-containing protein [Opitutae bacterium]|nr:LysM peptidoglycan-binding domain-containing protein [Opitutae bacterium]
MFVSFARASAVVLVVLTLSGCGYVHLGRRPPTDATLLQENADLRMEKKLLQQELVIVRKEGETLRKTLAAAPTDGSATSELAAKLETATRELATLRGDYAKLQEERAAQLAAPRAADPAAENALKGQLAAVENKLATALRDYTKLQEDNTQLRQEIAVARQENQTLNARVKDLTIQNERTQAAMAQLNTELLAQKDARAQAEQATEALRSQLHAVVTQARSPDKAPTLADSRESTASSARAIEGAGLRVPNLPATDGPPTATLSTNPERVQAAAAAMKQATPPPATPAPAQTPAKVEPAPAGKAAKSPTITAEVMLPVRVEARIHQVTQDETLDSIARKYYNNPERWRLIYAANNALLRDGRPLKPGMELVIPPDTAGEK